MLHTLNAPLARQRDALRACVLARVPVMFWGPPGVGKTAVSEQTAHELGAGFVAISMATASPEDAGGIPIPPRTSGEGVMREPLGWIVRANNLAATKPGGCIVLLDEFSCATPAVRASFLSLVQSRYAGDVRIDDGVAFVAASNPTDQAANGWELDAATTSRWVHLTWNAPSVEEWAAWLVLESPPSQVGQAEWDWARAAVVGYLARVRSALCVQTPPPSGSDGRPVPFPCPRSWFHATCLLAASQNDPALAETLVAGAVGHSAGAELAGWLREASLPDPEAVLEHPQDWNVPRGRADQVLATLLGVASATRANPTQERFDAAVEVAARAAEAGLAGACVVALTALMVKKSGEDSPTAGLKTPRRMHDLRNVLEAAGGLCISRED